MIGNDANESKTPNIRLKTQRLLRGWSQAYVAEHVRTNSFTVGRWERGERHPGPHFRARLRALFGLDDDALGFKKDG